jgi:hypothetical protein
VLRPLVTGTWVGGLLPFPPPLPPPPAELIVTTLLSVVVTPFDRTVVIKLSIVIRPWGVMVIVLVIVVVLFAFITEVIVCQYVVEYVAVTRADMVVVYRRVDVVATVTVLIVDIIVEVKLDCRFSRLFPSKGNCVIWGARLSDGGGLA